MNHGLFGPDTRGMHRRGRFVADCCFSVPLRLRVASRIRRTEPQNGQKRQQKIKECIRANFTISKHWLAGFCYCWDRVQFLTCVHCDAMPCMAARMREQQRAKRPTGERWKKVVFNQEMCTANIGFAFEPRRTAATAHDPISTDQVCNINTTFTCI